MDPSVLWELEEASWTILIVEYAQCSIIAKFLGLGLGTRAVPSLNIEHIPPSNLRNFSEEPKLALRWHIQK